MCDYVSYKTYTAGVFTYIPISGMNFTVGDKSCYNGIYNSPLKIAETYRFGILPVISDCNVSYFADYLPKPYVQFMFLLTTETKFHSYRAPIFFSQNLTCLHSNKFKLFQKLTFYLFCFKCTLQNTSDYNAH